MDFSLAYKYLIRYTNFSVSHPFIPKLRVLQGPFNVLGCRKRFLWLDGLVTNDRFTPEI